ncbi:MAG: formate/nitrite transporter family protein [bacterium]
MARPSSQAPAASPDLTAREHKEAERRSALTAATVYEAVRLEGEDELARPSSALAWSGVAAGLSMGFSLLTQALIWSYLPDAPWRTLVSRLGYTVGFIIVVLGRQQLFTENTLTPILPLLSDGGLRRVGNVARLWAVVLASNLVGTAAIGWMLGHTAVFGPDVRQSLDTIGRQAAAGDIGTVLLRGVFAGWLIALMVWVLPFAESARVTVILIITYVVALGGFTHIVAGSVDVFYLIGTGAIAARDAALSYMLPTLAGNVLGGVALVSALNHAQVMAGKGAGTARRGPRSRGGERAA